MYATSQYGEVFGPSADMPVGARFKWYVDNGVPIPPYLETAGLSQPGGPGTAVYFNDGSYVRYDDRAVGGPGYGAPDNPATWLRQMRQEAAARRATYPGPAAEVEEPVLGSTEYGSF